MEFNSMNEAIKQSVSDFEEKKDLIIAARLKEKNLYELFKVDKDRRFKLFVFEVSSNEEVLWYDNGELLGERIITFLKTPPGHYPEILNEDGSFSIVLEMKYY